MIMSNEYKGLISGFDHYPTTVGQFEVLCEAMGNRCSEAIQCCHCHHMHSWLYPCLITYSRVLCFRLASKVTFILSNRSGVKPGAWPHLHRGGLTLAWDTHDFCLKRTKTTQKQNWKSISRFLCNVFLWRSVHSLIAGILPYSNTTSSLDCLISELFPKEAGAWKPWVEDAFSSPCGFHFSPWSSDVITAPDQLMFSKPIIWAIWKHSFVEKEKSNVWKTASAYT